MAEIEITLPTVQYGNVRIRATPEELGVNDIADSYELGVAAAVYLNLFSQGFKQGAQLDVDAPQKPSAAPQRAEQKPLDVGVPGAAEQRVEGNLKPRTVDEANDMAAAVIKQELGATEVENEESPTDQAGAPWDRPAVAKPKPWQTDGW